MKTSELLDKLMKKYNILEGDKIYIHTLQNISKRERINIQDLLCLFEIRANTYYKLRKEKQKYTILKFNKDDKLEINKSVIKEKINKDVFDKVVARNQIKPYTLLRILGISRYYYNKMKNDSNAEVRVIDTKLKHAVDLIKMDLYYMNNKGKYYSLPELKDICTKRNISVDQFLKYYSKNERQFECNKGVIEKSNKGLWIGNKVMKINKRFMNKIYPMLEEKLNKIIKGYSYMQKLKDDLIQEAFCKIFGKCGDIVKIFYFDIDIIVNILAIKAKYIMLNYYRKNCHNNKIINYDKYENNYRDHTDFLSDSRYDPQLLIE